jgi:hypothetical protein
MKLSKILATSTIIGLTCTAALADNSINFTQSGVGDSINTVKFTQTGGNDSIGSTTASVTGSLDTLSIEQNGAGTNTADFAITTATEDPSTGSVQILTTGNNNTSDLTVSQSGDQTLEFAVAVLGNDNSVTADIDGVSSVVNLQSDGNTITYDLSQTGTDTNYSQSITANVSKTGAGAANVTLAQSGATNTITLGAPSDDFGTFDGSGTVGLTLLGAADVEITQSATLASYVTTQTVPAGGSLTVVQSD